MRRWLAYFVLMALFGVVIGQVRALLADPTIWPPDDFVEYWAAGRLAWQGQDPYAPSLLLPLQIDAGRDTDEAIMMWNPPWTLPVVVPLGLLPARSAQLLWLGVNAAAIGIAVWCFTSSVASLSLGREKAVVWIVTVTFVPVYLVLQSGQIGGLLVLGAAVACRFAETRPYLAGAALALLAIKPHLAYLVWPALLVQAIVSQRVKLLGAGVSVGLVAALLPLLLLPSVYQCYINALRDHPPAQWVSLTLGTLLRYAFGEGKFLFQFLPMGLGFAWLTAYAYRMRNRWSWQEALPKLLFVSFLTSPYGAWHFDLVLLLVPILPRAKQLASLPFTPAVVACWLAYGFIQLGMITINFMGMYSYWYAWVAPTLLIWDQACALVVARQMATKPKGEPELKPIAKGSSPSTPTPFSFTVPK